MLGGVRTTTRQASTTGPKKDTTPHSTHHSTLFSIVPSNRSLKPIHSTLYVSPESADGLKVDGGLVQNGIPDYVQQPRLLRGREPDGVCNVGSVVGVHHLVRVATFGRGGRGY